MAPNMAMLLAEPGPILVEFGQHRAARGQIGANLGETPTICWSSLTKFVPHVLTLGLFFCEVGRFGSTSSHVWPIQGPTRSELRPQPRRFASNLPGIWATGSGPISADFDPESTKLGDLDRGQSTRPLDSRAWQWLEGAARSGWRLAVLGRSLRPGASGETWKRSSVWVGGRKRKTRPRQ